MRKGQTGTQTHLETTPERKRRTAKRRQRKEAKWAARSGPVVVIQSGSGEPVRDIGGNA
jgi:hypothetical protein